MSQILGSINDHMSACMNTLTHTFFRSSRTQTCKIQVPILFWAKLPLDSMFRSTFMRPVGFWSTTWPVYILDWWPAISHALGSCLRSQKESTWADLLTCNFLMCVFHTAFCSFAHHLQFNTNCWPKTVAIQYSSPICSHQHHQLTSP